MKAEDNAFPSLLLVEQASAPATPAAGQARLYRGTDNKLYIVDDAGTATEVAGGGGGSAATTTFSPTGNIAATNVQAALAEVDLEKIAAAAPQGGNISTTETTSATTATDLATVGPSCTVTIGSGGRALVFMGALMWNSVAESYSNLWFAVSGATTMAASGSYVVSGRNGSTGGGPYFSGAYLVTGLNAGSNTFTLKYSASAGTASFARRSIIVIPL